MSNRAIVVDPEAPGRLVIRSVADPVTNPSTNAVIVAIIAIARRTTSFELDSK